MRAERSISRQEFHVRQEGLRIDDNPRPRQMRAQPVASGSVARFRRRYHLILRSPPLDFQNQYEVFQSGFRVA